MPFSNWATQRTNQCINTLSLGATSGTGYTAINSASVSFDDVNDGVIVTGTAGGAVDSGVAFQTAISYSAGVATYTVSMDVTGIVTDGWRISVQGAWAPGGVVNSSYVTVPAGEVRHITLTFTATTGARGNIYLLRQDGTKAGSARINNVLFEKAASDLGFFDGNSPNDPSVPSLYRTVWASTPYASQSSYQTRTWTKPSPTVPVKNLSTQEVLYGDRVTQYRWEVLEHVNGVDQLVGILDGVSDGKLTWTLNASVKGGGNAEIVDLAEAQAGRLRVADLALESTRLRPVCVIQGLPENPLGVFLVSNAKEDWDENGRVWKVELLDKTTVPSQDQVEQSYAVAAGTRVLREVRSILATCNEYIAIDDSNTTITASGMVWEAGTSKLKIINDLLDVAGFNALWMDGYGNFQATPRVLPANRSTTYEVLGIPRELRDGAQSIYTPDWTRESDSFEVPNKVIAVQAAGGSDSAALIGTWTNEDPTSPYSYQSRGRWITYVLDSVECPDGTPAQITTFLQNRARATLVQMSAVQAQVEVEHLPIPVRVGDALQFSHTQAGIDSRHIITKLQLDTEPLGTMRSTLQEVISL